MRTRKTFKGTMARTAKIKASRICAEIAMSFRRHQQAHIQAGRLGKQVDVLIIL
jgi:hypothetical protein